MMVLGMLAAGVAACGGNEEARVPGAATSQAATTVASDGSGSAVASTMAQTEAPSTIAPATVAPETVAPTDPPSTIPEVTPADVLERNPLYAVVPLQPANCSGDSKVALDTVDNVRAYYASVLPCLDAAWQQIGNGTGIGVRPAGLEVFTAGNSSPCYESVQFSYYCGSNDTIYMYADEMIAPWLDFPTDDSHGLTRLAATHTIAHEYGHHIQNFTGILTAVGPNFFGTEMERRLELQASCLGNVFLASQAAAYPIAPEYLDEQDLWRFITRVPNHGSEANQALWTGRGFTTAAPADCNTFTASAQDVA